MTTNMYDKDSFFMELKKLPVYWDAVDAVMEGLC